VVFRCCGASHLTVIGIVDNILDTTWVLAQVFMYLRTSNKDQA